MQLILPRNELLVGNDFSDDREIGICKLNDAIDRRRRVNNNNNNNNSQQGNTLLCANNFRIFTT